MQSAFSQEKKCDMFYFLGFSGIIRPVAHEMALPLSAASGIQVVQSGNNDIKLVNLYSQQPAGVLMSSFLRFGSGLTILFILGAVLATSVAMLALLTPRSLEPGFVVMASTFLSGLMILGALMAYRLITFLRDLARAAEHVRAEDFTLRLPARKEDEFGRLAETFNSMAERLGHYHALTENNRLLEQQITRYTEMEKNMCTLNRKLEERAANRAVELIATNERLTREISERETTQKKLMENRIMLQTVFDGISEPLLLLDRELRIKMMNETACKYYQLAPGREPLGNKCHHLFREEPSPCKGCTVPVDIKDGRPRVFQRKGFIQPDRDEKVSVYPIKTAVGKIDGCVLHIRDMTDEKRMERELMQADRMISLGILVSGVAHEINNPNNWIMLNAPILLETWRSILPILDAYYEKNGDFSAGGLPYLEMKEAVPRLLSGILGGSKRIMKIVNDLKDYARHQPGDPRAPVDINKMLDNAVSLVENQIKKSTTRFAVDYDDALPMIQGDWQRLEQVVINLLQNACQALPNHNSAIFLKSFFDKQTGMAAISVQDEGRGIPEKNLLRITDPFFTTKADIGGTGLGLSVSSKIIKNHGGRLTVVSREGKGATFTILLPLEQRSEKVRVLIVDDDEDIRLLMAKILRFRGRYAIREATNGAEACLMLGNEAPDVLILDINMPDMDGLEVCRQIRKTPLLLGIKVIIITGHTESQRARDIVEMGFTNLIAKPFSPKQFTQMVESVLRDKGSGLK
jgi:signal transduction histidine kinase/CheY-like chemotaxis protein/HAMP domain-containing protein